MTGCGCPVCTSIDGKIDLDKLEVPARRVRAECVVDWIGTGKGLELSGGSVAGVLCLDYRDVRGPVIVRSRLDGISAKNTTFKNVVDLSASWFGTDVNFVGAVFDRVLLLDGVEVGGKICLWATCLKSGLSAKNTIVGGEFDAKELNVTASAAFDGATFYGTVSFRRAHVGQTLGLAGAYCTGDANFDGAAIADLDLTGATFDAEVFLRGVHIAETLRLNSARFTAAVSFDECDVRDLELGRTEREGIPVEGPRFDGEVRFGGGTVHTLMTIANATFGANVLFEGLRVGGWRWTAVTFSRSLILRDVHVDRSIAFTACTMTDFAAENFEVTGMAAFERLTCTGGLKMTRATFCSDLLLRNLSCKQIDLSGTTVSGRLRLLADDANGALVGAADLTAEAVKLENVTVAQDAELCLRVKGIVKLSSLTVTGSLSLNGLRVTPAAVPAAEDATLLAASFLTVGRDLTFSWTTDHGEPAPATHVGGKVDASGAKVAGTLRFRRDTLPPKISLDSATLGTLAFDDSAPPAEVEIDLTGCKYDSFAGDHWRWLISTFRQSAGPVESKLARWLPRALRWHVPPKVLELTPFLQLEKALRNAGNDVDADAVFYEGRERTRWMTSRLAWWPQWAVTGYGVKPLRLLRAIILVWAAATIYFIAASGAVRDLSIDARTDPQTHAVTSIDDRKNSCGADRASPVQAMLLALELFVPTTFPDRDVVVAPGCDVSFLGLPLRSWWTSLVVLLLKLGGLILIPLAVVIVSGVLRPSAKA